MILSHQVNQNIHEKESLLLEKEPLDENTPKKIFQKTIEDTNSTLPKDIHTVLKNSTIPLDYQRKKSKRLWTQQEDDLLRYLVQNKGAKQWATISTYFLQRCGKQCRERWHNHLRSGIKKGNWSVEEQWILFMGVYAYGKKWSAISKMLKGRTENTLKNHWNCKMKPKKSKLLNKLKSMLQKNELDILELTEMEVVLLKQILAKNRTSTQHFIRSKEEKILSYMKKSLEVYFKTKKQIYEQLERTKTQKRNDARDEYKQFLKTYSRPVDKNSKKRKRDQQQLFFDQVKIQNENNDIFDFVTSSPEKILSPKLRQDNTTRQSFTYVNSINSKVKLQQNEVIHSTNQYQSLPLCQQWEKQLEQIENMKEYDYNNLNQEMIEQVQTKKYNLKTDNKQTLKYEASSQESSDEDNSQGCQSHCQQSQFSEESESIMNFFQQNQYQLLSFNLNNFNNLNRSPFGKGQCLNQSRFAEINVSNFSSEHQKEQESVLNSQSVFKSPVKKRIQFDKYDKFEGIYLGQSNKKDRD